MTPTFKYQGHSIARKLIEPVALKLDAALVVVDAYKRQGEPEIWLAFIHDAQGRRHIRSTVDYSDLPLLAQARKLVELLEAWSPDDPLPRHEFDDDDTPALDD